MSPRERATAIMETVVDPGSRMRVTDYLPHKIATEVERLIIEAIVEAESEAYGRGREQPYGKS